MNSVDQFKKHGKASLGKAYRSFWLNPADYAPQEIHDAITYHSVIYRCQDSATLMSMLATLVTSVAGKFFVNPVACGERLFFAAVNLSLAGGTGKGKS